MSTPREQEGKQQEMAELINDLIDSWINGNLSWVIEQVTTKLTATQAALVGALVSERLPYNERNAFIRLLTNRL